MNTLLAKSLIIPVPGVGPVLFERSARAKRLNISVKPFKGVRVAVPKGISFKRAEQLVYAKLEWMKHHVARMKELEKQHESIIVNKVEIDRKEARRVLVARLDVIAQKYGYNYNRVSIRNQKTRWGSCSSKNNINLNMKLTLLPDELRDYIILHELVHTKIKNHGKEFWKEMLRVEPDARRLDQQMKQHSILLL